MDEGNSDYDSISAVSGGALNAAILASYPKGEELEAADRMAQFWIEAGKTSLFKNWIGFIIQGLFWKGGLYDSEPLKEFLTKEFSGDVKMYRDIKIGIVDALTGDYLDFTKDNITDNNNLIDSLFASFSLPGFFPPAKVFGSEYFDVSAVYDLDIFPPVRKCIE